MGSEMCIRDRFEHAQAKKGPWRAWAGSESVPLMATAWRLESAKSVQLLARIDLWELGEIGLEVEFAALSNRTGPALLGRV